MSSDTGLVARGLGKRYELFKNPAGRLVREFLPVEPANHHWALRGLDMEAHPGECIGIIGRNGSGKSTLLGMLAGIVTPTEGTLDVRGRVVALLELGAGFNGDFSGRDNVFLSGAIYGMTEAEVRQRFASIEKFADIGEYIDRPVRQYSSGMFARLAFAVAAHVDADILIIDEILGVGDVRFQQRCSRFIAQFRRQGGVVLIVSHNEHMIVSLCTRAIWLLNGRMEAAGAPRAVAHAYHSSTHRDGGEGEGTFASSGKLAAIAAASLPAPGAWSFDDLPDPDGSGRIVSTELLMDGERLEAARGGESVTLRITCDIPEHPGTAVVGFVLRDRVGQITIGADSSEFGDAGRLEAGRGAAEFALRLPYLPSGGYSIDVALVAVSEDGVTCLARNEEAGMIEVLSRHISAGMANVALQRAELLRDGESLPP